MKSLILALAAIATLGVVVPGAASADPDHHDRWEHGRGNDRGNHGGYRWHGASWGHRSYECHTRYHHRVCAYRYW